MASDNVKIIFSKIFILFGIYIVGIQWVYILLLYLLEKSLSKNVQVDKYIYSTPFYNTCGFYHLYVLYYTYIIISIIIYINMIYLTNDVFNVVYYIYILIAYYISFPDEMHIFNWIRVQIHPYILYT